MTTPVSPTLKAVSDAVLAIAAGLSVDEVLQRLVDGARELAGARYAALGLPDGEGGFRRFLTSGMSDGLIASLGPLPRQHGVLGAMLETREPYRTRDIHEHPQFRGWWPAGHPDMRSFLGVPIVAPEGVIGAFYLTEKAGAADFSDDDEELIELLAAHAAIAITNARLYEQSRELSILAERNRLALDLHDAVSQKLFGLVLTAEAAGTLLARDPPAAPSRWRGCRCSRRRRSTSCARSCSSCGRPTSSATASARRCASTWRCSVVWESAGSISTSRTRCRPIRRATPRCCGSPRRRCRTRSGTPRRSRVAVRLVRAEHGLLLEVEDDGVGFDPAAPDLRARRLGLTSMEERAERVGGRLSIRSSAGAGTTVRLEIPDG